MADVQATHKPGVHPLKFTDAGDYNFDFFGDEPMETPQCLSFRCPCGCGHLRQIPVGPGKVSSPAWTWNGDREKPTLTPSIACTRPCGWHGYLTDGVFKPC